MIILINTVLADPMLKLILIHKAGLAVDMYTTFVTLIAKIHLIVIVVSSTFLAI